MIIYYSNVSGYTARFVEKLGEPALRIPLKAADAAEFTVDEEFVLIVPTYGGGQERAVVPKQVIKFLNNVTNRSLIRAVIGTGNRNFGDHFGAAADIIAQKCSVPLLYKLELAGMPEDVEIVRKGLRDFWENNVQ